MSASDPLMGPVPDAEHREINGVQIDAVQTGAGRVKRVVYPPGFRWSTHMKPVSGTEQCMHAHVGFIARGSIHIGYPDGCVMEYSAPQAFAIEPGHDGWVVGAEPAVVIEFDFACDTAARFGLPPKHTH